MIVHALMLNRAYQLLRLTRQAHLMTPSEIQSLDHEIDDLLKRIDPDATFDDPACLAQFKSEAGR